MILGVGKVGTALQITMDNPFLLRNGFIYFQSVPINIFSFANMTSLRLFIPILIGLLLPFVTLCQDVEFVLKKNADFTEEYYVLQTDKKTKHGSYVKYRQSMGGVSIFEVGNYSNGEMHGLWEYFYEFGATLAKNQSNMLKQKGTYINGKKNGTWTFYYLNDKAGSVSAEQAETPSKRHATTTVEISQTDLHPAIVGEFTDDIQTGEWKSFFYSGQPILTYNYSTRKLDFEITVENKDSLLHTVNQNRKPRYLAGPQLLSDDIFPEFKSHQLYSKLTRDSSTVVLEVQIDKSGVNKGATVVSSNCPKNMEKVSERILSEIQHRWVPGLVNGEAINSSVKIYISLVRNRLASGRFSNRQYIGFVP